MESGVRLRIAAIESSSRKGEFTAVATATESRALVNSDQLGRLAGGSVEIPAPASTASRPCRAASMAWSSRSLLFPAICPSGVIALSNPRFAAKDRLIVHPGVKDFLILRRQPLEPSPVTGSSQPGSGHI